jgi:release factor glutamine methyltransferase
MKILYIQNVQHLKDQGIETPELDVRLLLQKVTGLDRTQQILNPDTPLTPKQAVQFETLLQRRLKREPLAKILGVKEFWGLPFKTTADTLDPRPDSETLIEAVLAHCKTPLRVLDLGTGTGCLLFSVLSEYPQATGVGVDCSAEALAVAQENARTLGLTDRVQFIQSNWCEALPLDSTFDLILSNPPYLSTQEKSSLEPELAYDPEMALYSDAADGLSAYRILAQETPVLLKSDGLLILEAGQGQAPAIQKIFSEGGFTCVQWHKDLAGIDRCGVFSINS